MIHGFDEREHDEPKALGLLRIERARRRLGPAGLARLARRRRAPGSGAPPGQREEDEGGDELCSHTLVTLFRLLVLAESQPPLLEERH
jgi:hypothetical protein